MEKWELAQLERKADYAQRTYQAAALKGDTPYYHLVYLKAQAELAAKKYHEAQKGLKS